MVFVDYYASREGRFNLSNNNDYEALESRRDAVEDILDSLKNPNVNIIGVYGMGGIGKTTLVTRVFEKVMIDKIFDKAVFAWVSSTPNIKMIQGEIADQLDLELSEGSVSERARTLCHRLTKEERILVILDDIWTSLDLEMVGIPFGHVHGGCKILLTSRSRDVLVYGMHSQYNYCVSVLSQEESWRLFTKSVGDCIEEGDFRSIANQVAKECSGLPLALVTVGRSLRNKSLVEWEDALQELRSSAGNFRGSDALVCSSVELSYNYLIDPEVKSVFLLCGLMKRPYNAPIMDLLKYGMGLGLFEGTSTMQERRNRAYASVHKLRDSCLLLDGHTRDSFSMHDIVSNVAITIATRDHNVFTVRNDVPIEWPNMDIQKSCTAFSLHDTNIVELPQGLQCPELRLFYMDPKHPFFKIPDNFFIGMTNLTVLVLTNMQLLELPSSFHHLQNLETLCLEQCTLRDVATIGNMKKLEILSFLHSDIEQLPREMRQLTRLKFLNLSNCSKLKIIPPNVISSLSKLEDLYMGNTSVQWGLGLHIERSNASLQELKYLSHLTTLEIHIQDAMILPKGLFSEKLDRYKIFIGDEWDWSDKYESTRMLKLKLHTSVCLDEVVMQLKGMEELYLDEVPGIKNILYDLDREGFQQLKHLHVQNNPFISCIVDSKVWVHWDALPLLESLFLRNLIRLEKICHGQLTAESFLNLKIIKVRNCDKLTNIFSFSIARSLPQLRTIEVIKCKNVDEIFVVGREDNVDCEELDEIEFSELRSLTLKFLPHLTSFYSKVKTPTMSLKRQKESTTLTRLNKVILGDGRHTPMPFFSKKVVFPNLEILELCAISAEKIWHSQFAVVTSSFQTLTRLIVHSCDKLKYIFTYSIVSNFSKLQHLEISYCKALKEIVADEGGTKATAKFVLPRVTFLKLWNLPELRTICPGVHTTEWPLLKKLEVYACDKVKIFTSEFLSFHERSEEGQHDVPKQQALFLVEQVPNLEELKLSGKDINMICQEHFGKHLFQNLKILEVLNDKLEIFAIGIIQRFHNLEKLELKRSSYKEIFSHGEVEKRTWMPTKIKRLKLWELSDLMHICKQDSKLDSVVQNLEMLEVWWCDNLINLVPSSVSFENLTTLEVWCCQGLKNLVTPSTAKSLLCLSKLRVDGCKLMTEIISNEGDVAEDEIVFSKLKWLSLERLENLMSFCSGDYTIKFPSLEDLFVIECPNMKNFSHGILSTPMLQEVRQNWGLDKGYWEGDINTTIQRFHENESSSPLLSIDSPPFSLVEATTDKLFPNLSGHHETKFPYLLPATDSPSFSPMFESPSPLSWIDLPSFPPAEDTIADKLFHNLFNDSHETQSSSLLSLVDSPSFSVSEITTTDKLSPDPFGSQRAKSSSPLSLVDSPSFSVSEITTTDKLSPDPFGSQKAKSSSPLSLVDSPSFSVSEITTTDKLSPDPFGSQKAKGMFPPGLAFNPSDEVLVSYYLMGKVAGCTDDGGFQYIKDIELYEHEPWELPGLANYSGHNKMYFFTRQKMNARGADRQTRGGFWKKTGKSLKVCDREHGSPIAVKSTLVYYAKTHETSMAGRTLWVVKEYVLLESQLPNQNNKESEMLTPWTLCVLYASNRGKASSGDVCSESS